MHIFLYHKSNSSIMYENIQHLQFIWIKILIWVLLTSTGWTSHLAVYFRVCQYCRVSTRDITVGCGYMCNRAPLQHIKNLQPKKALKHCFAAWYDVFHYKRMKLTIFYIFTTINKCEKIKTNKTFVRLSILSHSHRFPVILNPIFSFSRYKSLKKRSLIYNFI